MFTWYIFHFLDLRIDLFKMQILETKVSIMLMYVHLCILPNLDFDLDPDLEMIGLSWGAVQYPPRWKHTLNRSIFRKTAVIYQSIEYISLILAKACL